MKKICLLSALSDFIFGTYEPKVKSLSAKSKQILIIIFLSFYFSLLSFGIQLRKQSLILAQKA